MPSAVFQQVQQRLWLAIDTEEPELVYGPQSLNSGIEKHTQVWEGLKYIINQQLLTSIPLPPALRHWPCPLKTLLRKVSEHLEENFLDSVLPIPSTKLPEPLHKKAPCYTGWLQICSMIQARQLQMIMPMHTTLQQFFAIRSWQSSSMMLLL